MEREQQEEEEEYIDMEVSPPPQSREFEFQMSSITREKETTTPSPADELFYKGKLLPLHLPPRLQMVQKLLQEPFISISTAPPTNSSTPLDSCNISPTESCRASCELNPDEYLFHWSAEMSCFAEANHPRKSWSKKFRLVKQSSLSQKLKDSRAYLNSLFSKSMASSEAAGNVSKAKEYIRKYMKVGGKNPLFAEEETAHRRSFSGAIRRHCGTKCLSTSSSDSSSSSSSFSLKSNGCFYELKRSSSANSEVENGIQGAIAHCKKSQQLHCPQKTEVETGSCLLSASRVAACGGKGRADLSRM